MAINFRNRSSASFVSHVWRALLLFSFLTPTLAHSEKKPKLDHPHVPNRLIVKRKQPQKKTYLPGINAYLGAKVKKSHPRKNIDVVEFDQSHHMEEALFLYGIDSAVAYAEPDYLFFTADSLPNDSQFSSQWGLHNDGSSGGVADVDINAPALWDLSTGHEDIIVAVVDTGVNYDHPDLAANMWRNPGEIPDNGIDDDLNGYIDDVFGINGITKSGDPMDDHMHGSHVAGIIAGVGGNEVGISGVMQEAKIVACKFLSASGSGSSSDAITCIDYLNQLKTRAQNPVNIVASNNSWASSAYSQALHDAISEMNDNGILFVAAADNRGLDNDRADTYPANYRLSNVLSVAAIDHAGSVPTFSNYGRHSVHIAAPGVDILSTVLDQRYSSLNGTSMATPFATGLFALLNHKYPEHSIYQTKNLLLSSGKKLDSLNGKLISEAMIRAHDSDGMGAATCTDQELFTVIWPKTEFVSLAQDQGLDIEVLSINCSEGAGDFSATISPGEGSLAFTDLGLSPDRTSNDGLYTATFAPEARGSYHLNLNDRAAIDVEYFDSSRWSRYYLNKDPDFSYSEISGTKIELGDDDMAAIKSPFAITFGGDDIGLRHIYIGSNGTISLSEQKNLDWENTDLPLEDYRSVIAPLWFDLDPSTAAPGEGIFYETLGEEPQRQLVIEWRQVKHYATQGKISFQVQFFEDSSDIVFSYQDLDMQDIALNGGESATIGVQVGDSATTLDNSMRPIADQTSFTLSLNSAPVASAGDDAELTLGEQIDLDGSMSFDEEDHDNLTYWWELVSGPSQNVVDEDSATARLTASNVGISIYQLTVTDQYGAQAQDSVAVTVIGDPDDATDDSGSGASGGGGGSSSSGGGRSGGGGGGGSGGSSSSSSIAPSAPIMMTPDAGMTQAPKPLPSASKESADGGLEADISISNSERIAEQPKTNTAPTSSCQSNSLPPNIWTWLLLLMYYLRPKTRRMSSLK